MLQVQDLHAYYGKSHILQGVDMHIDAGEVVSLLGRNGVGRSTTVKAIMGEVPPHGTIKFKGENIAGLPSYRIAHLGLGYVPEHRDIFPGLTVRQNLMLGIKDTRRAGKWRLEDMLECNRKVLESVEPSCRGSVDEVSRIIGRVVIEEGASIVRSTVRGPAIIGRGTRIVDSYIGPFTSIYHDCLIDSTELEHSIVLEATTITGVSRIEDSLIGKEVEVSPSTAMPRAHRLMLGDHSKVSLA